MFSQMCGFSYLLSNSNCSKPHFALDAKEITSNKNKNYINIYTRDVESDARILLNVCQFYVLLEPSIFTLERGISEKFGRANGSSNGVCRWTD